MSALSDHLPEYVTRQQRIVEDTRSAYQHIVIAHDPAFGHLLYLDDDLQIAESDESYNQAMVRPALATGNLGEVLILGGGDGGVLNAALRAGAHHATMVDIDAEVLAFARRYLPNLCGDAFDHERATVVIGDAFEFLAEDGRYDAILYDLTMDPVREGQTRDEFIDEMVDRIAASLKPGGILSMQCCSEHDHELRTRIVAALRRRFGTVEDRLVVVPSYGERWVFASAHHPS